MQREQVRTTARPFFLPLICVSRFIVRDFVYSEEEIVKQRQELQMAATTEKELWVRSSIFCAEVVFMTYGQTELLRLARTNFSESFQILVHLKVIRLFVESVLRYGLPAEYMGIVIKVGFHCHSLVTWF